MNKPKSNVLQTDIAATNLLKGISIIGVIFLHIFTSTPGFFRGPQSPLQSIALDQILRFSVPLFVALSGYALARRYLHGFSMAAFFERRVLAILPLYLLWSLLFIYVFPVIFPAFGNPSSGIPVIQALLFGKADYHLYFVPMIVQLYLLFPLIVHYMRRFPVRTLAITGLIQIGAILLLTPWSLSHLVSPNFIWDQSHYAISFFWIFYFALGIWLAENQGRRILERLYPLFLIAASVGLLVAVTDSANSIRGGLDTILALRFTRFPVVLYAAGLIGATLHTRALLLRFGPVSGLLEILGKNSYLIYLSHFVVLRILASALAGGSIVGLLPAILVWLVAFGVSLVIQ